MKPKTLSRFLGLSFRRRLARNGRFLKRQLNAPVNFNNYGSTLNGHDFPVQATDGYHIITFLEVADEVFLIFLFLLLGPNHEKVHDPQYADPKRNGKILRALSLQEK